MIKLSTIDQCLISTLTRLKFATREQLAYWCKTPSVTIFKHLATLEEARLVAAHRHRRPAIWKIKPLAAALMLTSRPSGGRQSSLSVMTHACHTNEVEIMLNKDPDSKGFRFMEQTELFKRGLNPAHGEHVGVDDAKKAYLVLLDDYTMKPERIGHAFARAHHPPRQLFSGNRNLKYSQIVNYYIVATTDEFRAAQHATWIKRHEIPARVITIKPLWI